jgi:hypothetical protein
MFEFDPEHLPGDRHLRAIGLVAVIWSGIEASMEIAICGLYGIELGSGLALTNNIGFQGRVGLLRILADGGAIKDAREAQRCRTLIKRLEKAYLTRNEVLHSLWAPSKDRPGSARRMSIRARGRQLRAEATDLTAEDLEDIARRLGVLSRDWRDLLDRLGCFTTLKAP